jgi:3-phosphoshikimate 1-carboxyvinyltransferase
VAEEAGPVPPGDLPGPFPAALELLPAGPVSLRLAAPASKSVTNRALLCAALAEGTSHLYGAAPSDDARAMAAALAELGAGIDLGTGWVGEGGPAGASDPGRPGPAVWTVTGTGGRPASPGRPLDARLSGTTMRFLAAAATLTPAGATVTGAPPLLRRPVGPLVAALAALGAGIADAGGFPPVTAAGGGLAGGAATVDAAASSQFASAVLLVAPYARQPVELTAERLGAAAYVDLTAAVMRRFGAEVDPSDPAGPGAGAGHGGVAAWRVEAGRPYRATDLEVEYDASAAAHLFALAAATGGTVTVTNADPATLQPDAALPALLEAMGASVTRDGARLTVRGPEALGPVDADLAAMPDQVTTVAALAALATGPSRIRGVAVARGHETDRLAALAAELGKLGVAVAELPDGLVVTGPGPDRLRPARLATWGDHRMAMALAAVAARVPGVVIEDPACVAKTYPGFWADLAAAGLAWRAHPGPVA